MSESTLISYTPDLGTIAVIVVVWLAIYLLPMMLVHRWALRMKPKDEAPKKWVKPVFASALVLTMIFHWMNSLAFYRRVDCGRQEAIWNEDAGTCTRASTPPPSAPSAGAAQ